MNDVQRGKGRRQLILLAVVFALPVVLAWVTYLNREAWLPGSVAVDGNLIQPPRPLPELTLATRTGEPFKLSELRGKWTVVTLSWPNCNADCRKRLTQISQTRLALGEEMHRVQRLLVVAGPPAEQMDSIVSAGPDILELSTSSANDLDALLASFRLDPGDRPKSDGRIFVVDPLGNLMMYHEPTQDPKALLRDLRRLLKASQVG